MRQILYVTTNIDKFHKASIHLKPFGIELMQSPLEMLEVQSTNGEEIARDKAQQAYQHFQQPVLVNDDTWAITALRGFPSTGMKLCNDFLKAEDWLRLMHGLEDRQVFLLSYYAFHDGKSVKTSLAKDERFFLHESRGYHEKSPFLQVIAKKGSEMSVAEEIESGLKTDHDSLEFWEKLSSLVKNS